MLDLFSFLTSCERNSGACIYETIRYSKFSVYTETVCAATLTIKSVSIVLTKSITRTTEDLYIVFP